MVRAAIYIRVSDPKQAKTDKYSLDTQLAECLAHCEGKGYAVEKERIYREVHTAVELYERPELTRLRADMNAGSWDALVVHQFDRLSREPRHRGLLFTEAEYAEVGIESVLEGEFDLDNDEAELIYGVKGYTAKQEWRKFRERSIRGRRGRINSGKYPCGWKPPYGYAWGDDKKTHLLLCPLTSPIVARIFRLVLEGQSCRAIARALCKRRFASGPGVGLKVGHPTRLPP